MSLPHGTLKQNGRMQPPDGVRALSSVLLPESLNGESALPLRPPRMRASPESHPPTVPPRRSCELQLALSDFLVFDHMIFYNINDACLVFKRPIEPYIFRENSNSCTILPLYYPSVKDMPIINSRFSRIRLSPGASSRARRAQAAAWSHRPRCQQAKLRRSQGRSPHASGEVV